MQVRPLLGDEVLLHRDLRLAALRDSPASFEETAADMERRPMSFWEKRTRSVTRGPHVLFLACEEGLPGGMVYGLRNGEEARIGGLWVAPGSRRRGAGRSLLEAVVAWAGKGGMRRIGLWAPAASEAALALYRKSGFTPNGRERALGHEMLRIVEMQRLL
jgi:GNAT superfamily N-acetyltransferase